jgi:hypothetical protein
MAKASDSTATRCQRGLARLERRFAEFRAAHPRGTRVPGELRGAALALLDQGVSANRLHAACGVSTAQLRAWRAGAGQAEREASELGDVRVFSVLDGGPTRDETLAPAGPPVALELRFGPWAVTVRLAEVDHRGGQA